VSLRRQDILEPTAIRGTDDHGDHRRLTITSADPRERRPDPTHILGVTNYAIRQRGRGALAVATPDGMGICLRSRRAADEAQTALTRVGRQVVRSDRTGRPDLLVTGWSAAGLKSGSPRCAPFSTSFTTARTPPPAP